MEVQQYANKRPLLHINRSVFSKTIKEWGILFTAKRQLGKTKHHKFRTILKVCFTLSVVFATSAASAQVCRTTVDHSRVIIGATDSLSTAVKAGLFNARFDVNSNEIALIAGQPCIQAYYAVYDEDYRFITCGAASMLKEGEVRIVKVGRPADKCRVVLSVSPFFTSK